MAVIIERLNRAGRVLDRQRFNQDRISIGRGYDNDIILDEPHVDAHHADLVRQANGEWLIRDLGSKNGITFEPARSVFTCLESGVVFSLGRVRLRFLLSQHPVAAALPMHRLEHGLILLGRWPVLVLLFCIFAALNYADTWLATNAGEAYTAAFKKIFAWLLILSVWAGFWSLLGRVFKHEPRLLTQFALSFLFASGFIVCDGLANVLMFNSLNQVFTLYLQDIVYLLLSLFWLSAHLLLSTQLTRRARYLISSGVTILLLGLPLAFQWLWLGDFDYSADYVTGVQPPVLRFVASASPEAFQLEIADLFAQMESSESE